MLGYFKVKPVVLNIRYSDVREDLQFIPFDDGSEAQLSWGGGSSLYRLALWAYRLNKANQIFMRTVASGMLIGECYTCCIMSHS